MRVYFCCNTCVTSPIHFEITVELVYIYMATEGTFQKWPLCAGGRYTEVEM